MRAALARALLSGEAYQCQRHGDAPWREILGHSCSTVQKGLWVAREQVVRINAWPKRYDGHTQLTKVCRCWGKRAGSGPVHCTRHAGQGRHSWLLTLQQDWQDESACTTPLQRAPELAEVAASQMSLNDTEIREALLRVVRANKGTWTWGTVASLRATCSGFRASLTGAFPDMQCTFRPTQEEDEVTLRKLLRAHPDSAWLILVLAGAATCCLWQACGA